MHSISKKFWCHYQPPNKTLSLLGYLIPLLYASATTKSAQKRRTCFLEFPGGINILPYFILKGNIRITPLTATSEEGTPLYVLVGQTIPPKLQAVLNTGIWSLTPQDYVILISGVENISPQELLTCPAILDPAYKGEVRILLGNLTDSPIIISSI